MTVSDCRRSRTIVRRRRGWIIHRHRRVRTVLRQKYLDVRRTIDHRRRLIGDGQVVVVVVELPAPLLLLEPSFAVNVIVCVPSPTEVPGAGLCVTVIGSRSAHASLVSEPEHAQLSDTVAVAVKSGMTAWQLASAAIVCGETEITGGVTSLTVIVCTRCTAGPRCFFVFRRSEWSWRTMRERGPGNRRCRLQTVRPRSCECRLRLCRSRTTTCHRCARPSPSRCRHPLSVPPMSLKLRN